MKVGELLTWYGDLRGGVPAAHVVALCERLGLDRSRRIGELSTGNRRKVGIVQAVMHRPDLLILDEPTSGLDPLVQREVLAIVREQCQAGAGVLFSSHVLPEVEDIAARVTMLRKGRIVHESGVAQLRSLAKERIEFRLGALPGVPLDELLDGVPGAASWQLDDHVLTVDVDGPAGELLRRIAPLDVQRIRTSEQDLEQNLLRLLQRAFSRRGGRRRRGGRGAGVVTEKVPKSIGGALPRRPLVMLQMLRQRRRSTVWWSGGPSASRSPPWSSRRRTRRSGARARISRPTWSRCPRGSSRCWKPYRAR